MLKPIALTLLGLALITTPINAQGDADPKAVGEVITQRNRDLEVLGDGSLLIRFTVNTNLPSNVNLQTSDYAISFWSDSNEDPDNPNVAKISGTATSPKSFDLNKSESLSIESWCSNIGRRTPVLMALTIELLGVTKNGSEVFREVKVFHTDVSRKVEDCENR